MPYTQIPAFLVQLRARESYSRLALEYAILTAARSGEVRGALWEEIDFDQKLWTIAKDRMKANREHVVPLCMRTTRIIERCAELRVRHCPIIFPGMRGDKPMSDMALTKLLREMKQPYTAHGFRSAFRDWVSEETDHQGEVAEAALAHVVKDKTEAAYRRGNLLKKRRKLMEDWATYCVKPK
jgi:integrase